MISLRTFAVGIAASLLVGAAGGYAWCKSRADKETAAAVAKAHEENMKRNDEVVHGWASAVDLLRARLRAGYVPRIPVSATPAETNPACGLDGRSSDSLSLAGELATCRAERTRLIEDCSMTTIQLRSLQDWAKP